MARIEHLNTSVPFDRPSPKHLAFALVLVAGCVDAPITPEQLREDGGLRQATANRGGGEQLAFSAVDTSAATQRATQISAVLAEVGSGPLSDRSRFDPDVGTVHLHLRADGLTDERAVVFRWTHEATGQSVVVPGILLPAETLRHVATHTIEPGLTGAWTVEVLGDAPGPDGIAEVLWHRDFEIAALAPDDAKSSLH